MAKIGGIAKPKSSHRKVIPGRSRTGALRNSPHTNSDRGQALSEEEICAGSCAGVAYFYSTLGIRAKSAF